MSGIPYNELQDVNFTVNDTDGTKHVIATLHYAFVIPCKECRYYEHEVFTFKECKEETHYCNRDWNSESVLAVVEPNGFCAWACRKEQ